MPELDIHTIAHAAHTELLRQLDGTIHLRVDRHRPQPTNGSDVCAPLRPGDLQLDITRFTTDYLEPACTALAQRLIKCAGTDRILATAPASADPGVETAHHSYQGLAISASLPYDILHRGLILHLVIDHT